MTMLGNKRICWGFHLQNIGSPSSVIIDVRDAVLRNAELTISQNED